jgi:hypothetical protein
VSEAREAASGAESPSGGRAARRFVSDCDDSSVGPVGVTGWGLPRNQTGPLPSCSVLLMSSTRPEFLRHSVACRLHLWQDDLVE